MHGVGTFRAAGATGTAKKHEIAAAPNSHPRTSRTRATGTEAQCHPSKVLLQLVN